MSELDASVRGVIARSSSGIDSAQLLRELIEVWGGPAKLARDVHAEFQKATAGGQTRQRILEMIQRLIITNTTGDIGRPPNASDLDDGELEATAIQLMKKGGVDAGV